MTFASAGTQLPIACHSEQCLRQQSPADRGPARPPHLVFARGLTHRFQHSQYQHQRCQPSRRGQQRCRAGKWGDGWPNWARGDGWPGSMLKPPGETGSQGDEHSKGKDPSISAANSTTGDGSASTEGDSGWQQNWDGWDQDWDDWESTPISEERQKYERMASRRGPRDAYLRPMIDKEGIRQRFTWNADEGEEALRMEFEVNQFESREAVKFAGILVGVPLVAGFILSRLIADPIFYMVERRVPLAFAPTDSQKVEGARHVHTEELRLNMDIAIGRAPPLSDGQMQGRLRKEAHHLVQEFREHNKQALVNVISDSTTGMLGFAMIAQISEGRALLFRTISRVFSGLSDTAKAFIIIASTDILLGYHSEEGWTAAIRLILMHYGVEVEEDSSHIFVAIVPVVLDSIFKYWIFVGLNRQDPAATVTLKSMDRH